MIMQLLRLFAREFARRRKKSALITFALMWGSMSILLMMAFGRGIFTTFQKGFQGFGSNVVLVSGGQTSRTFSGLAKGRSIRLQPGDVAYLRQCVPQIAVISPESYTTLNVAAGGRETNRSVSGVFPEFAVARSQTARRGGRFLDPVDERNARRVAFLGWKVAANLFPGQDPLGREIRINRTPFVVVGVQKKKLQVGTYGSGPDCDIIYIPFSTFRLIYSQQYVDHLVISPRESRRAAEVERDVRRALGRKYRFDPDDEYALTVLNAILQMKLYSGILNGIEVFLGIMGALTMLIGAIGVTNLMVAVARERTREIGLKMALGARRVYIVWQFLFDTARIFARGTAWGAAVAGTVVFLVRRIPLSYETTGVQSYLLRPVFSFDILLAFLLIVGLLVFVAGIFPALKAARQNPVEALRYE